MEVVVSAAVLVIVVLGALAAIDAVTSTAGANKARTVAAALAERDQEELRSLRTAELNTLKTLIPAPRTVQVDRVTYTVTSDAQWVTDAQGKNISCALTNGDGSFLRITSTVSSNARGVKPITLTSIVAPQPGSGTLTVIVKDVAGNAVKNLGVEATGPSESKTKATDDSGCAVFGAVESGAYTIKLDQSPYFSTNCIQQAIKNANVAAGSLTTVEMLYDRKATGNVNVTTVIPPSSTAVADPTTGVTFGHNLLDAKFCTVPASAPDPATYDPRPLPTSNGLPTGFTNVELFPFTTSYKVYAGRCTWADPARYGATAWSFSTPAITPGGSFGTITVREPATNIKVTRGGSNRQTAYIHAYPTGADCNSPSNDIKLGPTQSNGVVQYPGLPFGDYEICAEYFSSGSNSWWRSPSKTIQNRVATGATTTTTLDIANSGTTNNTRCVDPTPPPPEDGT